MVVAALDGLDPSSIGTSMGTASLQGHTHDPKLDESLTKLFDEQGRLAAMVGGRRATSSSCDVEYRAAGLHSAH